MPYYTPKVKTTQVCYTNTMKKPVFDKIPITSGVYIFKRSKKILYVGKAKNLRDRLRNYFAKNANPKTKGLTSEATTIQIVKTQTEPDSLILESQLIKKYQPEYNVVFRDDKSYFYIAFSNDKLPRVSIEHAQAIKEKGTRFSDVIGPFTDGTSLKKLFQQLRKVFEFCTCKGWHQKPCIQSTLGLCAGACCIQTTALETKYPYLLSETIIKKYKRNILVLKAIFQGRQKTIVQSLKKEMKKAAKQENFEKAGELRDFIYRLEKIWQHSLQGASNDTLETINTLEQMKLVFELKKTPWRIEGYDISNIFGTNAVGSMAVFHNGEPDKNHYRKFKMRFTQGINDFAMLQEMISRRLRHKEWQMPDLFFIDGGKGQLNAAKSIINGTNIDIISFAKGEQEVFSTTLKSPIKLKKLPRAIANLIVQIKDEAHRFAIGYHKKLRSKSMTSFRSMR